MSLIITDFIKQPVKLGLQTCKCSDIENEQHAFISSLEINQGNGFEKNHSLATFKGRPTAVYNCHGMTFASKRTGIFDDRVIETILEDDSYIEIKDEKDVLPGDVIIYYEDNNISHSGVVCQVEKPQTENDLVNIMVWSKWAKYKEVIHNVNDSPYSTGTRRYWRTNHGFTLI